MTSHINKRVLVTGISGVGKSSVAMALKNQGVNTISTDEDGFCSWVCKTTNKEVIGKHITNKEFTQKHRWICDLVRLQEAMNKLNDTVVVCGGCSNHNEYLRLFDTVLFLKCRPETLIERLNGRTSHDFGKDKAVQQNILSYKSWFEDNLLRGGAIQIDAELPLARVIEEITPFL